MSVYHPNKWLLLNYEAEVRIFSSWSGGYLSVGSWRISSAVKSYTEDDKYLTFQTATGSEYICHKQMYGVTTYGGMILSGLKEMDVTVIKDYNEGLNLIQPQPHL